MSQGLYFLTIGDEILDGRTLNTNATFFGEQCRKRGISVAEIRTVSDKVKDIIEAIRFAGKKHRAVLVTGGLGPTNDDRTMEAASKAFRRPLVQSKETFAFIQSHYNKRGLPLTPERMRLALFPKGAKLISNPTGTARGSHLKIGKADFFFLPGVPGECRPMFEEYVLPRVKKLLAAKSLEHREFWRCFGKGESAIYHEIKDIIRPLEAKYPDTFVFGVHISFPYIDLTLESWKIKGKKSPAKEEIQTAVDAIQANVKNVAFTHERETLEEVVSRLLREKKATLATAESCTGGLVGKMLTDITGASDVYLGGVVSYANEAKIQLLSVRQETLQKFGAVSEETAKEMSAGIRTRLSSTYSLAISGISGPGGGTESKPVGTTCIAIAGPRGTKSLREVILRSAGNREQNRIIAAHLALNALREEILTK